MQQLVIDDEFEHISRDSLGVEDTIGSEKVQRLEIETETGRGGLLRPCEVWPSQSTAEIASVDVIEHFAEVSVVSDRAEGQVPRSGYERVPFCIPQFCRSRVVEVLSSHPCRTFATLRSAYEIPCECLRDLIWSAIHVVAYLE